MIDFLLKNDFLKFDSKDKTEVRATCLQSYAFAEGGARSPDARLMTVL